MKTLLFLSLLAGPLSFAHAADSACAGATMFPVTHSGKFVASYDRYLKSGGAPEGLVLVQSLQTILASFAARPYPAGFAYNKKARDAMGFKFGVSSECQLRVSRFEYGLKSEPAKNVHHHLLAFGDAAYSAGAIFFFHDGHAVEKVIIGNRSGQFCPAFESLSIVRDLLVGMGVPTERIELLDQPNDSSGDEG